MSNFSGLPDALAVLRHQKIIGLANEDGANKLLSSIEKSNGLTDQTTCKIKHGLE